MKLLPEFLGINDFVNADNIAHGLSAFNMSSVSIEAGRIMLKRITEG
jgi:predicted ABC-type ATPase